MSRMAERLLVFAGLVIYSVVVLFCVAFTAISLTSKLWH